MRNTAHKSFNGLCATALSTAMFCRGVLPRVYRQRGINISVESYLPTPALFSLTSRGSNLTEGLSLGDTYKRPGAE